jgi:hypothetical protein
MKRKDRKSRGKSVGSRRRQARQAAPSKGTGEVKLEPAREVQVTYRPEAAQGEPGKRIHARRPLPLVPEGDVPSEGSPGAGPQEGSPES